METRLAERARRARAASLFVNEIKSTNGGEQYSVPGREGRGYQVKVRRNGRLSFQCFERHTGEACPGNSKNGTICYHSMAVAEALAAKSGKHVSWCKDEGTAKRLARTGGKAFKLVSHQGQGCLWCVVK